MEGLRCTHSNQGSEMSRLRQKKGHRRGREHLRKNSVAPEAVTSKPESGAKLVSVGGMSRSSGSRFFFNQSLVAGKFRRKY